MATLEKIRSKSALLLIIVGAALLAFIIGDFFTSGRTLFGPGTTVAKVGKQKIDVQEFQQRVQQATQQMQGRKIDSAVLNEQVLEEMIAEKLFLEEAEELGLTVTDEELTEAMLGRNSAMLDRMIQQQTGLPDARTFYDMAFNPAKYGMAATDATNYQNYWVELEKQVENTLLRQKFQNLFAGTFVANDLDSKAFYDENASTASVLYTKKDYSTLADADYEPTEAEIKALYDEDKKLYELMEPLTTVNYIAVNIVPSDEDKLAAEKKVEDALAALNSTPDIEAMADYSDFVVDRAKQSKEDLSAQIKGAVDSIPVGKAALVSRTPTAYTIAKLLGRSNEITDVTLDFLTVEGNRAHIDSLVALLNNGANFDSIAATAGQAQKDLKISLLDPSVMEMRGTLETAAVGRFFSPDTAANLQAGRIFRITDRKAPSEVLDLATITYEVLPSAGTVNKLQSDLMNYVAANKTAQQFTDSAQANGYTTFPAQVTPSSPSIGNIEDSHAAVAWVMDAKKGEVSSVFGDEQSGKFFAVAVNNIYKDYVPVSEPQLKANYTTRARNDKKAAALIEKYNGKAKDIPGYAALMESTVDTTTVNFGQMYIAGIGTFEDEVLGSVANAKPGQLVGPLKGNNAVIVLQVTGIQPNNRPYDPVQDAARYNQQRGASRMLGNMDQIIRGNRKVENNMTTFFK